jgi:hypothetical protein
VLPAYGAHVSAEGARGYSLNLANTMAQFGAAYLAGFIALVAVLRIGR